MYTAALAALSILAGARAQQVGTNTAETHPKLTTQKCTTSGGCVTQQNSIVLDSNWRWVHSTSGYTNCYTGNTWDSTLCPDPDTCAKNCALDGADYSGTYGISTSGNALTLGFKTGTNVGSRTYLMDTSDSKYQMFDLRNQEFTFTVDMSTLPCGLNGALYFSEMVADGGMSEYTNNKAGAKYGTGYCDSQCPHDIKFINGQANLIGWNGTSANSGTGSYGSCCNEMDIWEANVNDAAYTPHVCTTKGQVRSTTSLCDQAGCDFNSFRLGQQSFLGPGLTVDTTKPITVVTQFITNDNTATGTLTEIRRIYVQNGNVIQNSNTNIAGITTANSITDKFCAEMDAAFDETNTQLANGGLAGMGAAFSRGMVLVLSIWDDYAVNMLWLDSDYPTNLPNTNPGVHRGNCSTSSGSPASVEANGGSIKVIYSNIKYGDIGSTFSGQYIPPSGGSSSTSKPPTSSTTTKPVGTTSTSKPVTTTTKPVTTTTTTTTKPVTTTAPPTNCAAKYGQCGGTGWTGATCCASGSTCKVSNPYYSQCL